MKVSEIMVGDLLKYTTSSYIQVASITKKKIGYHIKSNEPRLHYVRLCEVNPIPLTPEILEKNGFKKYNELYRLDVAEGVFVNADFKSKEPFVSIHNTCYRATPICWYLHQLQHALRLCGIEKEIEL